VVLTEIAKKIKDSINLIQSKYFSSSKIIEKSFLLFENTLQLKSILPLSNMIMLLFEDLILRIVFPLYEKLNHDIQLTLFSKVN
jgi:hypothetical protein